MDEGQIAKRNMKELLEDLNNSDWSVRAKAVFELKRRIRWIGISHWKQ